MVSCTTLCKVGIGFKVFVYSFSSPRGINVFVMSRLSVGSEITTALSSVCFQ